MTNKKDKVVPIVFAAVLLILIIQLIYSILNYFDFQQRVEDGNDRWRQVEERIKEIERCCERAGND